MCIKKINKKKLLFILKSNSNNCLLLCFSKYNYDYSIKKQTIFIINIENIFIKNQIKMI